VTAGMYVTDVSPLASRPPSKIIFFGRVRPDLVRRPHQIQDRLNLACFVLLPLMRANPANVCSPAALVNVLAIRVTQVE
jgi:hypothetical protein